MKVRFFSLYKFKKSFSSSPPLSPSSPPPPLPTKTSWTARSAALAALAAFHAVSPAASPIARTTPKLSRASDSLSSRLVTQVARAERLRAQFLAFQKLTSWPALRAPSAWPTARCATSATSAASATQTSTLRSSPIFSKRQFTIISNSQRESSVTLF